jgi:hypothetical protein
MTTPAPDNARERIEDRLLDRELFEVLGRENPPVDLAARILARRELDQRATRRVPARLRRASSGRRVPVVQRRRSALPWAVAGLLLVVLGLVVFNAGRWPPSVDQPAADNAARTLPPKPAPSSPSSPSPGQPAPPAFAPSQRDVQGQAAGETAPRAPRDEGVSPPRFAEPDEQIERELPPARDEGRDTRPDRTDPKPGMRPAIGRLASLEGVKVREGEAWVEARDAKLLAGVELKAALATLVLEGGALLRVAGHLRLDLAEGAPVCALLARASRVYADALGVTGSLTITGADLSVNLGGACAFVELGRGLEIGCLEGRVSTGQGEVGEGCFAELTGRGLSRSRPLTPGQRAAKLVASAPARVQFEHGFDSAEGVEAAKVENGAAVVEGDNACVLVTATFTALQGTRLVVRFRATQARALYVQVSGDKGARQYGQWIELRRLGEWQELVIPMTDLVQDTGTEAGKPPAPGFRIEQIKLFIQQGRQPRLEVDSLRVERQPAR